MGLYLFSPGWQGSMWATSLGVWNRARGWDSGSVGSAARPALPVLRWWHHRRWTSGQRGPRELFDAGRGGLKDTVRWASKSSLPCYNCSHSISRALNDIIQKPATKRPHIVDDDITFKLACCWHSCLINQRGLFRFQAPVTFPTLRCIDKSGSLIPHSHREIRLQTHSWKRTRSQSIERWNMSHGNVGSCRELKIIPTPACNIFCVCVPDTSCRPCQRGWWAGWWSWPWAAGQRLASGTPLRGNS